MLLLRVFVSLLVWDVSLTASLHSRMFIISVETVTCHLLITTEVDERKYAASRNNDEKRHEIVLF
jgi:hypothetical protein